jgi:hypothetical protein
MKLFHAIRFEVLTVVSIKSTVFWNVVPCSLVEVYKLIGGTYCVHLHYLAGNEEKMVAVCSSEVFIKF